MTAADSLARNPFLKGNFSPVDREEQLPITQVIGEIPKDLAGSFLRIGPNPVYVPDIDKYHWFDGDGMIHRVSFDQGKADYQNRYVRTKGFEIEQEKGHWIWKGINSVPDFNNPYGMPIKNVGNTALVWHAGRLLALWEAGSPHEIGLPDLTTHGEQTFDGDWADAFTAHPKVDPFSGEMITFGYHPMSQPHCYYGVMNAEGKVVHRTGINMPKGVMIHDCAITPHFTLILDLPITFDIQRAMSGDKPFQWEPENGARIGVLPRYGDGDSIRWFEVDTCYAFHTVNAYEEGDEVVLEACRAEATFVLDDLDNQEVDQRGRLYQWRFNLSDGSVKETLLSEVPCDFPRINEGFMGRSFRYSYASRFDDAMGGMPLFDAVLAYDRQKAQLKAHEFGDQRWGGEFVFAPKVGAEHEQDGYLVGFVWDEKAQQSECLILDAQDIESEPLARLLIPTRVPYGFHAHWVSADDIAHQRKRS